MSGQAMQDMSSHPKLPPLPGHALAGERLKLNEAGKVRVAKPSSVSGCGLAGWPWHAPCALRGWASLGCFSVGASRSGAGVGGELGRGKDHS